MTRNIFIRSLSHLTRFCHLNSLPPGGGGLGRGGNNKKYLVFYRIQILYFSILHPLPALSRRGRGWGKQKSCKASSLILLFLLLSGIGILSCSQKKSSDIISNSEKSKKISYYTCSMHRHIHSDKPGNCPICGMTLVPVYDEETSSIPTSSETPGRASITLSPEKQQRIGVKTEIVTRKPLLREIHTTGRVAYDPNLLLAQNEYLIALKSHPEENLMKASRLRLQILGMSEDQIRQLSKSNKAQKNLVLPAQGGEVWVYASLFESDLPWVKAGMQVQVEIPGLSEAQQTILASIDPVIDPVTRMAQVRLKLSNTSGFLKADMYLKLNIQTQGAEVLSVPSSAILYSGNHSIAFVDLGNGKFEPRNLKIGRRGSDNLEVLSGLTSGERIVTSANFLIDSEFQLKSAGSFHD